MEGARNLHADGRPPWRGRPGGICLPKRRRFDERVVPRFTLDMTLDFTGNRMKRAGHFSSSGQADGSLTGETVKGWAKEGFSCCHAI